MQMLSLSRYEKLIIRGYYSDYHKIRFTKGIVLGKRRPGDTWGVLYTEEMLARHLAVIRNS